MFDEEVMEEDEGVEDDDSVDEDSEVGEEEGRATSGSRRDLLESDSEGEDPDVVLGRKPQEKSTFEKQQEKVGQKCTCHRFNSQCWDISKQLLRKYLK